MELNDWLNGRAVESLLKGPARPKDVDFPFELDDDCGIPEKDGEE